MAIDYESNGRIRIIRFNRPEKRNALNPAHLNEEATLAVLYCDWQPQQRLRYRPS